MRVLLTGATGFVGRELLVRLLARGDDVLALTRPRDGEDDAAAQARLLALVERTEPGTPITGLTAGLGDVTAAGLSPSPATRRWLEAAGPVAIVHGAAEVRFDLPREEMRRQNVEGTANVLALARGLAERGRLAAVHHVSTAFVAGDRTDLVAEADLDAGQRPRNEYERSKLEAEGLVRAAQAGGLPVAVHRPSIVVGDARTGRASSYKVLYWPMKVYARGRFRTVFGRPGCTVDVVPVDFVADALAHLLADPAAPGRTFHLAAGPARQARIIDLVRVAEARFGRRPVRFVDPDVYERWLRPVVRPLLRLVRPDVARQGGVFLPYLRSNPSFDVQGATAVLAPAGLAPPPVLAYFDTIMAYAQATDFGRRPALPSGA